MKVTAFFSGLILLIACIFFLNAQENGESTGDDNQQNATVQTSTVEQSDAQSGTVEKTAATSESASSVVSNIVEESGTKNGADEKAEKTAESSSPAASNQNAAVAEALSSVSSAKTNAPAEQLPPAIKPDKSKDKASVDGGKEALPTSPAADFEIDRGGAKSALADAQETGRSPAKGVEPAKEEKAGQKPEGKKSFWGRLFGTGGEKRAGAQQVVTNEQPVAKNLAPEELLAVQEEVRRQAREIEGLKELDQAYQEMSGKEFEKALKHFNEGLSLMPVRPHTVETRQKAMLSEAECEYRLALRNYQEGKVKEAREGIRRALEYFPAHRGAARLEEKIKQDDLRRVRLESQPVSPKMSPAYQDKQKKIKSELQRGREYMAIKEYNNAENEFRSVLADDRLNEDATANLQRIAEKRYDLETDEFQRLKAEMLSQIRDTWTPPVKKVVTGPKGEAAETIITSQARRRLVEKLNNIMIPELNFRDANMVDVITYLHQQSVAGDKDSVPGEKGVNIILNLRRPGQAAGESAAPAAPKAESADLFAAEETATAAPGALAGSGAIPKITLSVRNISLMEALKYITEFSGLRYRVEERVVIILPADVVYGDLETRTYKVQPSMVETFTGGAQAAAAGEGDKMEIGGGGLLKTERQDMKKFFIDAGIPFPEGTTLVYIPSQTQMIVKNTAENLENFERLLNKLNVPPVQVEIEARFVEIGQNDLEEIGLEWLLTDNWELAQKQSGLPPSMRERLQMNKNNFTKGLRELNVSGGQVVPGVSGTMGSIVSLSSILTNPELTVVLHALAQKDGINLLSAPKVTTKSGASAEIKVVEELIYPTEYQQQAQSIGTTTSGNQSIVQIIVTPSAFETRDTGVILQVTPTVGPDNETIDLAMVPQVVELARWIDYGSDVPTGDVNRPQHLTLNQPIFHSRSITTSISIWDGQTVVMGGLITEGQRNTEDKVPLLGDIPLLGYLFRSTTTQSIKKNLLIFVTANLVDPAGNRIKKETGASILAGGNVSSATP